MEPGAVEHRAAGNRAWQREGFVKAIPARGPGRWRAAAVVEGVDLVGAELVCEWAWRSTAYSSRAGGLQSLPQESAVRGAGAKRSSERPMEL